MARDLLVFGEDWGGHPSSTQNLVSHLANQHRVMWVNSIGLRQPRFSGRDLGRVATKLLTAARPGLRPSRAMRAPFPVCKPLTIPAPRTSGVRKLAATALVLGHSDCD